MQALNWETWKWFVVKGLCTGTQSGCGRITRKLQEPEAKVSYCPDPKGRGMAHGRRPPFKVQRPSPKQRWLQGFQGKT